MMPRIYYLIKTKNRNVLLSDGEYEKVLKRTESKRKVPNAIIGDLEYKVVGNVAKMTTSKRVIITPGEIKRGAERHETMKWKIKKKKTPEQTADELRTKMGEICKKIREYGMIKKIKSYLIRNKVRYDEFETMDRCPLFLPEMTIRNVDYFNRFEIKSDYISIYVDLTEDIALSRYNDEIDADADYENPGFISWFDEEFEKAASSMLRNEKIRNFIEYLKKLETTINITMTDEEHHKGIYKTRAKDIYKNLLNEYNKLEKKYYKIEEMTETAMLTRAFLEAKKLF